MKDYMLLTLTWQSALPRELTEGTSTPSQTIVPKSADPEYFTKAVDDDEGAEAVTKAFSATAVRRPEAKLKGW